MALLVPYTTPGGKQVLINNDALNIATRIQKGDPTCGWEGDPAMFVVFNYQREKYEVWRHCEDNRDRIISSWGPREFDSRVLVNLAQHDTHHVDVLSQLEKEEAALTKEKEEKAAEAMGEAKQFMRWAAKRLYLPGTNL